MPTLLSLACFRNRNSLNSRTAHCWPFLRQPGARVTGKRSPPKERDSPALTAPSSPLPCLEVNALFAIAPFKFQGFWVFDDPAVGLKQEPFVSGADTTIDVLTADIPNAESGFKLVFSPQPFPGYTARFEWKRPEMGGNWYSWTERNLEGWLCPA